MKHLTEHDEKLLDPARHSLFRSIVGKAQWILRTRPDLLYSVKELSRQLCSPREVDMVAAKRMVKYLWHTRDFVMGINPQAALWQLFTLKLDSASDSDWAGCQATRCSTSGVMLWLCGALVTALCRTQTVKALSSPEAEYYACSIAFAEAKYVMSLMMDWGLVGQCIHMTDSSSAIVHASRLGLGGIRHMEVRYLWVQGEIRSGRIPIKKVPGLENPTDIATKHVDTETMIKCQAAAGLRRWAPSTGLVIALVLPVVTAAASDNDESVGCGFVLAMCFAIYGVCQAGLFAAAALRSMGTTIQAIRVATHTVGTQTDTTIGHEPPTAARAPERFFMSQRGDCYHQRSDCKGLATRTTEMIEVASRPLHLRPCSKCHVD